MQLSKVTRIVLIISAVVLVLGLAAMAVWSGSELDLVEVLGAVGPLIAGVLAGLGIAGGRGSAAVMLLAVALGTSACAGAQRPDACETERVIVDSLGAGLHAADMVVGDRGGEHYGRARVATLGALELGDAAVDACELLRDGAGWQAWVALALEAAGSLAAAIDGAGPADTAEPVPPELERAIELLEAEARQ